MRMNEFDIIRTYFKQQPSAKHVKLGIGDDCALMKVSSDAHLAVSTDMLLADRHFFRDVDPFLLGYKTIAVNLSDLAAMGATPLGVVLSAGLPQQCLSHEWLDPFVRGLFSCLEQYQCPLVGGDTCGSEQWVFNVTVMGEVPNDVDFQRSSAKVGDHIWVSGCLGGAGYALQQLFSQKAGRVYDVIGLEKLRDRLEKPEPRLPLAYLLRPYVHSAIDVSDGLFQDLGHVLTASHVGADIDLSCIPYEHYFDIEGSCVMLPQRLEGVWEGVVSDLLAIGDDIEDVQKAERRLKNALFSATSGEDYELCFTASPEDDQNILDVSNQLGFPVTCIGRVTQSSGLSVSYQGRTMSMPTQGLGFDHFGEK